MSFLGWTQAQAKKPFADVLPDGRKRLTRYFQVSTTGEIPPSLNLPPGTADDWTDAPTGWTGLLLTYKKFEDDLGKKGEDTRPILQLIYEQIAATGETMVGDPNIAYDQYNNKIVTVYYVQFSSTTATPQTVGVSAAPAPNTDAILKQEDAPDDGTLRQITRIYTTGGTMSDVSELRFGGKVITRVIVSLNAIPATPSGYTLVGPGVVFIRGLPLYTYQYATAAGAGTPGTGGVISYEYFNAQGAAVDFNPASPNSANGSTRAVIQYVSTPSVTSNPITTPTGFVLVGIQRQEDTGYVLWTGTYYRGQGLVVDETEILAASALVVYHRVQFGSAPSTPSATIGGTVTLFESSSRNETGYIVYDYRWAEGDGQSSIAVDGQPDGALDYTVTTFTLAATTPAYPGSGTAYLVRLNNQQENAYTRNIAIYRKPPATQTLNKKINFTKPGNAVIGGSPIQFVLTGPVTMDILADVEVSYLTSQITDTPFTVESYATYYETYTPADTGIEVATTRSLGGYLAGASGTSGTGTFNGIICTSWEYQLGSSTPSSFSAAVHVLDVDNDPYLTATDGTVVFRRTKVSYDFS